MAENRHGTFVYLPEKTAFIFFGEGKSPPKPDRNLEFKLDSLDTKTFFRMPLGLRSLRFWDDESFALWKITNNFYRGPVDAAKTPALNDRSVSPYLHQNGFENYLAEEPQFDFSSQAVKHAAREVLKRSENAYSAVGLIKQWLLENIKYVSYSKSYANKVARIVEQLSNQDRQDFSSILKRLGLNTDLQPKIPRSLKRSDDIAKAFLEGISKDQRIGLYRPHETYASAAILSGTGICESFSNAYVAIARCLGIPSRKIIGWGKSDLHAWPASYIHPYRWVEVEATWKGEFDALNHGYLLSREHLNHTSAFDLGSPVAEEALDAMRNTDVPFWRRNTYRKRLEDFLRV